MACESEDLPTVHHEATFGGKVSSSSAVHRLGRAALRGETVFTHQLHKYEKSNLFAHAGHHGPYHFFLRKRKRRNSWPTTCKTCMVYSLLTKEPSDKATLLFHSLRLIRPITTLTSSTRPMVIRQAIYCNP